MLWHHGVAALEAGESGREWIRRVVGPEPAGPRGLRQQCGEVGGGSNCAVVWHSGAARRGWEESRREHDAPRA